MSSIALGIFILAIIYVVLWSVINDDARSFRDQKGIIRMRIPPGDDAQERNASPSGARRSTPASRLGGTSRPAHNRRRNPESGKADSDETGRLPRLLPGPISCILGYSYYPPSPLV